MRGNGTFDGFRATLANELKARPLPVILTMKATFFLALALVLAPLGAFGHHERGHHERKHGEENDNLAQGGRRIGRISIGDSTASVARRIGAADKTSALGRGLSSLFWREADIGGDGQSHALEVVFRQNRVTQIEVTSLEFETTGGLSLGSTDEDWTDALGKPVQTTYFYRATQERKRYLDWKAAGLALELVQQDGEDGWVYQSLIVHRKGGAVVPDRGGKRE